MRAVLLKKTQSEGIEARLSEVPVPRLGGGDVLVKMAACGLCGTDIEKIRGEYTAAMPVIGHEAVGFVSAAGEGVDGLDAGERVFPHHHVPCGECYYCTHGSETMCPDYKTSNLDPGGFSEFIRVPSWNVARGGVLKIPEGMTDEVSTMVEPLACCVRAYDRCRVAAGDTVLVVGAGPVGMTHAIYLRTLGAEVMLTDVSEPRLRFAADSKVGAALDASRSDVPSEVRRMTGGRGTDLAMVASGSPRAISQAVKSVRRGGVVCLFGIPVRDSMLECSISDVYNSDLSIVSSYGATERDTAAALAALSSGKVDLSRLVTHRFALSDFQKGVEAAVSGEAMKVVITP